MARKGYEDEASRACVRVCVRETERKGEREKEDGEPGTMATSFNYKVR